MALLDCRAPAEDPIDNPSRTPEDLLTSVRIPDLNSIPACSQSPRVVPLPAHRVPAPQSSRRKTAARIAPSTSQSRYSLYLPATATDRPATALPHFARSQVR